MKVNIYLDGKDGVYDSPESFKEMRSNFKFENPNPNASIFNKYTYPITVQGRFDVGLYGEIHNFLNDTYGDDFELNIDPDFKSKFTPSIIYGNVETIDGFDYYYYQLEAIEKSLAFGRGVISLPTASGKTLVVAGLCKTFLAEYPDSKILIMVPSISLLTQTYNEFVNEFDFHDVTRWTGDKKVPSPDFSKSVVISNAQYLTKDVTRALIQVKDYDMLIMDEVHTLKKGNKTNKIVHNMTTPNRFGLTGTVPKNLPDMWNVYGKIGPLIYKKKSSELRETVGSIAEVEVKIIKLTHKKAVPKYRKKVNEAFRPTGQYIKEMDFLYTSKWRNDFISKITNKLNGNVLILVDRIAHGEEMVQLLNSSGKKDVRWVCGDIPDEERQVIFADMEINDDLAVVAMDTVFSTGISVKNLKYVVFVCIGKSYTKLLQSIGRSLRLHANKKRATIFDISDHTKYSSDHLLERLEFYKEEEINYEIKDIKENR